MARPARHTVAHARTWARHSVSILRRLDPGNPNLRNRRAWTFYGHAPGKRGGRVPYGFTAAVSLAD